MFNPKKEGRWLFGAAGKEVLIQEIVKSEEGMYAEDV